MKHPEYQNDLSIHSPILLDANYKKAKVEKMLSILRDADGLNDEKNGIAVDIGCSGGFFTNGLAKYFSQVIGLDIDTHALSLASKQNSTPNLGYVVADSLAIPLPDNSINLVICNHVYEHVPNPEMMFSEIFRVLESGGICYLGSASCLTIIEPHYHLPFLSWLPKPIAHRYMRYTGKGNFYYENLRTYQGIKKLIKRFKVYDYTLRIIQDPDKFAARDLIPKDGVLDSIPLRIWKLFYWFLPTYIFVLKKPRI